jgi:TonB-linked SusC/RagA family outer membrane protein
VKGTTVGTITDIDGKFTLSNVPSSAKTLQVSFVGMQSQEVAVRANVRVTLKPDSELLEEVVVTAMGISRSEKTLGYSATTVKSDQITMARNTNVTNSLQGKVAGLQVQSTSTSPGTANSVVIRGFGSINGNNQPLYVVDGVPLQSSNVQSWGHTISASGINNIPSDDIESMTILKGAAATALYGSRAANGVIIVTTKSGSKGDNRNFSIEYNGGVQARQISLLPEMQNNFGQGWNGAQTYIENGSWGPALDGSQQVYGPIWNGQQLIHEYSARKDNVKDFFDIGVSWNNNISLSGISDDKKMTYYLSYSNTSDDGIMPTSADSYNRNSLGFRGSYEASEWLKVSSSVNYSKASTDIVGSYQGTSVVDGLYEMPRDVSIVDMKDLSNPFNTPEAYYTPYGITNPYWALKNNYNHLDSKQLYGKVQVDTKPIKDMTLSYRFGFDYSDYDAKVGSPQINLDDALIEENYGYAPSNMNQDGYVFTRYYRSHELNHDFLANYTKKFNVFDLNVNAGVNMNERYRTYMTGQTDGLTFFTDFWDLSNGATKTTLTEFQEKRRLVGLFGDITLGYDDMLFLNLTARNDWSSTLPIDNNSFFYPGATLSWIFTRLLPENTPLSFGKVRLAYGKTGNDASPYYTSARYVQAYANGYYGSNIVSFPTNGTNAFIASTTAGSNSLKPEMTSEFEAGLNVQFFNGRLGLDAAYYDRTTKDQIYTLPVDPSTGYNYVVTNFGEVRNQGIELLLNTTPVQTKNFRWDLNFNFALNRNKVISVPESLEGGKVTIYSFSAGNDAVYMYAEEGKPMGRFYTYLPKSVTDVNSPYYGSPIVDSAGQPVLSSEVEDTGFDMNHKWTGGLTTSFSAYGVTLSATLDIRYGGYMFSRTKNLMQFTGNGSVTTYNSRRPFIIPNSVQENSDGYVENTTAIKLTDGSYQNYYNNYGWGNGGKMYLLDRSYTKVRNITIGYSLPKTWLRPLDLNSVSVSAFVNNPFIWTAKENTFIDPETSTVGNDLSGSFGELYANPSCRIYGFNLSVKF